MKPFKHIIWVSLLLACLAACDSGPNVLKGKDKDQGREETKMIEAVDAVGYDGKAIRQKLDKVLDDNERRNRELEMAAKKVSGESD